MEQALHDATKPLNPEGVKESEVPLWHNCLPTAIHGHLSKASPRQTNMPSVHGSNLSLSHQLTSKTFKWLTVNQYTPGKLIISSISIISYNTRMMTKYSIWKIHTHYFISCTMDSLLLICFNRQSNFISTLLISRYQAILSTGITSNGKQMIHKVVAKTREKNHGNFIKKTNKDEQDSKS